MGKSFKYEGFYDEEYDFEQEDNRSYRNFSKKKNDKKREIQQARKKAQAERDKAIAEYADAYDE